MCVSVEHLYSQHKLLSAPQERGLVIGVGSKIKVPLGSSYWRHAGRGEWTSLDLGAQKGGEEGVPAATGRGGGRRAAPARPFQGGLMHQTSIFRTIELVIFFLLN